jgi:hypothetical protein
LIEDITRVRTVERAEIVHLRPIRCRSRCCGARSDSLAKDLFLFRVRQTVPAAMHADKPAASTRLIMACSTKASACFPPAIR